MAPSSTALTTEQLNAATDPASEVLCLACAGSGKTRTMAYRIVRLVEDGAPPNSLVAFTFTEKAAESIKYQVSRALVDAGLSPTLVGAMFIGTIHSFCQFVLGESNAQFRQYEVLDENRLKLFLISRYPALSLHTLRVARGNTRYFDLIKEVASAWQMVNDEMLHLEDIATHDPVLATTLGLLREKLNTDQYIDFSSMIRRVVDALRADDPGANRAIQGYRHLMVDEYQDVNPSQEALISELHRRGATLFVVGDDDQAIYSWRGADVNNILSFEQRYASSKPHTLSHNFRSTQAIVEAADSFVSQELGAARIGKSPTAENPNGLREFGRFWFKTRSEEADWVARRIQALLATEFEERSGVVRGLTPGDFAVLMRSTRSNDPGGSPRHFAFTAAFDQYGIPYTLEAGGGVFDRPQVQALNQAFELLRHRSPSRDEAKLFFDTAVISTFPAADFRSFSSVLGEWGRLIHAPIGGARRRVFPQELVHSLLEAFRVDECGFDSGILRDIGVFSRAMQDVESVYVSIDSKDRFCDVLNFLANLADSGYDAGSDHVVRRPDAVSVSTVHKMKGLEFPVVFVADVEAQRFPAKRSSYRGWLPSAIAAAAIQRGAYQGSRDQEARLFYTALTRAERFLYVTGSEQIPGGKRPWSQSPFALRLTHPEVRTDIQQVVSDLKPHAPAPRVDDVVVPTSYSDVRTYLRCPRDYQFRNVFGFSPKVPEMFGFGKTVHTAVCKLHEVHREAAPTTAEARSVAESVFHLKHVPASSDPVSRPGAYENARARAAEVVSQYAETYTGDFTRRRQVEARFEIPVTHAVVSGSIDLLLQVDEVGNILDAGVVDFKTMEGGIDPLANSDLHWTELALQVQLYAKAARDVLGEAAATGAVHLLKDNQRVEVPVDEQAIGAAVANVEWAVERIIAGEFPMRPIASKCKDCDFRALCRKTPEEFTTAAPPPIHLPDGAPPRLARAFSEFDPHFGVV